jgi:Fe-S cluster biogenesis protein NfuA/nitrite reductase/ring-hydroxylating ferredoxin subunit
MNSHELQELSSRIETLLDEFGGPSDLVAQARAESLVRAVMDLYAAGLARVVELTEGSEVLRRLADDELVAGLLLLHDLHPDPVDARIQRALDRVRPYLGSHAGGIDYLGVDDVGVAHLTLQGSCSGCPSSSVTVTMTIETAILEVAPEVVSVDVVGVVAAPKPKPLLQIGLRPGLEPVGARGAIAGESTWESVQVPPDPGLIIHTDVGGLGLLLANLDGTAYAYVDECPHCEGELVSGTLRGQLLTCPQCGARYNVRLAGRALDLGGEHLSPLPLLPDGAGWKVALPGGVPA